MTGVRRIVTSLREAGLLLDDPGPLPDITDVTDDSRRVRPGALFCAMAGLEQDGHAFVRDAERAGAAAAMVGRRVAAGLPQIVVTDPRHGAMLAAREWFDRPAEHMRVVAVTGTNGKTTSVQLIRHLLGGLEPVGSLGTLGCQDPEGTWVREAALTTPGSVELQRVLADLRGRGAKTVVMEASSHALSQGRLEGVPLATAVYTNLSHDHLDYHPDLEAYRAAKLTLSSHLVPDGAEVVNADDPAWAALPARSGGRRLRYGRSPDADVRLTDMVLGPTGSELEMELAGRRLRTALPLLGEFNVVNALAAAAAVWALTEDQRLIAEGLPSAPQVPGRMERVHGGRFTVLRDFAHTPDALDRALGALRALATGRLIVVFGAGGDRDRAKRPLMGRIAARGADFAVLTSDNPRTEDPERILDEVEGGMSGVAHLRVTDRQEAIERAVRMLEPGDCLLLAGKGHETYQVVGTARLPFDERAIVERAVAERQPA